MKKINLIIDGSNLAFRQYFGIKHTLTNENGDQTTILYGFLRSLLKLKKQFPQARFWIAWDGHNTERKEIYPGYKSNREKSDDKKEIYKQIDILKGIIPCMGITSVYLSDQEADDIIGSLAVKYFEDHLNYIYANDRDFFQLVRDGSIIVLLPKKGEYKAFDEAEVENEFGVPPDQIVQYRALDGDKSDNIPRVPYLKKAVIKEAILKYGTIDALYNSTFSGISLKDYEKLKGFEKQAKVNLQLMKLNTSLDLDSQLDAPPLNIEKLKEIFEKNQLDSLLIRIDEFSSAFGGKKPFFKTGIQSISL